MKIKIESDVFDIAKRVLDIDKNYFILFDTKKNKYELHRYNQGSTYCLTCPYDNLDSRFLDLIYLTDVRFIDRIVDDIDKNNEIVEKKPKIVSQISQIICLEKYTHLQIILQRN